MKILVDMNLSPDWIEVLKGAGWEAIHWSTVGNPRSDDSEIMRWARENGYVVFTHDLDFGTALALTRATGPSVLQIRTQDVSPESASELVLSTLRQFTDELIKGALIVVDQSRRRARILPLDIRKG